MERALFELHKPKPSGKSFIRDVFDAVESALLIVIGDTSVKNIGRQTRELSLRLFEKKFESFPESNDRASRLNDLFYQWVTNAHPFRHGGNLTDINEADLDLALCLGSQGMTFIRIIVSTDHEGEERTGGANAA